MCCSAYHPDKRPSVMALDLPFLPLTDLDATQPAHEANCVQPHVRAEFAR